MVKGRGVIREESTHIGLESEHLGPHHMLEALGLSDDKYVHAATMNSNQDVDHTWSDVSSLSIEVSIAVYEVMLVAEDGVYKIQKLCDSDIGSLRQSCASL